MSAQAAKLRAAEVAVGDVVLAADGQQHAVVRVTPLPASLPGVGTIPRSRVALDFAPGVPPLVVLDRYWVRVVTS